MDKIDKCQMAKLQICRARGEFTWQVSNWSIAANTRAKNRKIEKEIRKKDNRKISKPGPNQEVNERPKGVRGDLKASLLKVQFWG